MISVLVIDDEPQIRRAIRINLEARGYTVFEAADGRAGVRGAADHHPDLVLLDLGLPDIDGLDVLIAIRVWNRVPVIMLTVRDAETSKVAALDAGADDYITKPFGINELLARMRAVLRRVEDVNEDVANVDTESFSLDLANRTARLATGESVRLTKTEWALVDFLARHRNRLVTHRQLVDTVWGPSHDIDGTLLRVHFSHIRAKLEVDSGRPKHFLTEAGIGYRFVTSTDST